MAHITARPINVCTHAHKRQGGLEEVREVGKKLVSKRGEERRGVKEREEINK
jgi:hypothetical protein